MNLLADVRYEGLLLLECKYVNKFKYNTIMETAKKKLSKVHKPP